MNNNLTAQDIADMDRLTGVKTTSMTAPQQTNTPQSRIDELRALAQQKAQPVQPAVVPLSERLKSLASSGKALVGGFSSGVAGPILTAEDYVGRKLTDAFGSEEYKKRVAAMPSLNEQYKQDWGGNEHPNLYGGAQLAGEVAGLAAPVSAVGNVASKGLQAIGAGQKVTTLGRAGVEGAAFTAGQGLAENKSQSLGDYAINTGLNMAFPGAGMALKGIAEHLPSRIINSLIKPLQKDFAYGKNPGQSVAELGIIGNNFDELINNIRTAKNEVGQQIGSVISQSKVPERIDLAQTLSPIDEAISNASKTPRTNASVIQRLEAVKSDIMDNIGRLASASVHGGDTLEHAQELKGIVGDLTKWTGNISDDKAVNMALKQTYGKIRTAMDSALQKALPPEQFAAYKKASEHYGNLMSAENAAIHRDKLVERQDLVSFGAKNFGILSALSTAIATGGAAIPAMLAGLGGIAFDKASATPAFKTRLAKLLSKLAPQEVETFFEKVPTAKGLFNKKDIQSGFSNLKQDVSNINKNMAGKGGLSMQDVSKLTPEQKKTLLVVHNTTPEKLRTAQELGSMPNPSLAVYDPNKLDFTGYGDITLVAPKDILFSKKAHVFGSDVYSPRMPQPVVGKLDWKKIDAVKKEYDLKNLDVEDYFRNAKYDDSIRNAFAKEQGFKGDDVRGFVNKNEGDFHDFVDNIAQKMGLTKRFFNGFSPSGTRLYKEYTAENASKMMNKEDVRGGEGWFMGLGSIRAKVAPQLKNISAVKKQEHKLMNSVDFEKAKNQYDRNFDELLTEVGKYDKGHGGFNDSAQAIGEYLGGDKQALKYLFNEIPPEVMRKIDNFGKSLIEMPTEYFEAKFKRPVDLNEFSHAIVPETIPEKTRKLLEGKGIQLIKYKEGDRANAIKRFAAESGMLMGMFPVMNNQKSEEVQK